MARSCEVKHAPPNQTCVLIPFIQKGPSHYLKEEDQSLVKIKNSFAFAFIQIKKFFKNINTPSPSCSDSQSIPGLRCSEHKGILPDINSTTFYVQFVISMSCDTLIKIIKVMWVIIVHFVSNLKSLYYVSSKTTISKFQKI